MGLLKRIFGSGAEAKANKGVLLMELKHQPDQLDAVKAALVEFIDAHKQAIEGKPRLSVTEDATASDVRIVLLNGEDVPGLNQDLQRKMAAHGIGCG